MVLERTAKVPIASGPFLLQWMPLKDVALFQTETPLKFHLEDTMHITDNDNPRLCSLLSAMSVCLYVPLCVCPSVRLSVCVCVSVRLSPHCFRRGSSWWFCSAFDGIVTFYFRRKRRTSRLCSLREGIHLMYAVENVTTYSLVTTVFPWSRFEIFRDKICTNTALAFQGHLRSATPDETHRQFPMNGLSRLCLSFMSSEVRIWKTVHSVSS